MSGAMSGAVSGAMTGAMNTARSWGTRETGVIRGVCATIAERAGVPVWMPRAAFVIFAVLHWLLALIAYFVMARFMCTRSMRGRKTRAARFATPAAPPPSAVRDRFGALDARLADLEAATLQQETSLRRAFQDLERS